MTYITLTTVAGDPLLAAPGMIQLVTAPTEGAPDGAHAEVTLSGGAIWFVTETPTEIAALLNPTE